MQAGDQGESRSEPWTYSRNSLPTTVYTTKSMIKCGSGARGGKPKKDRVKARRKKNFFKIEDAERILSSLVAPEDELLDTWSQRVIIALRSATLTMLDKLLVFLPAGVIETFYDWIIGMLDKLLGQAYSKDYETQVSAARRLIRYIADKAGIWVKFE